MPRTVNGIGTWYYGKRNVERRLDVCQFCGRTGQIESYDTGHYFVVLFIPVLPLGKKRILDYCPSCTRHRVVSLSKWREFEDSATRDAIREAEANPDNPDSAVRMLATLTAVRRLEEARQYAELMVERFRQNADVQMFLGAWFAERGQNDRADACFRRALELSPDSLPARRAVAVGLIERGELGRARELLAFMEQPDGPRDPAVLGLLAGAYQDQGRHDDALHFYELAVEAAPQLARDRKFRQRVAVSDQALGRTEPTLPPLRRNRKPLYVVAGLLALAAVVLLGVSWHYASHQTLHVVNGFGEPVGVSIDGGPVRQVPPQGRLPVELAEGAHQAVVRRPGAAEKTVDFEMHNGLYARLAGGTVFVLDAGSGATLVWNEIVYQAAPAAGDGRYKFYYGDDFYTFHDVDYPFTEPARQLTTEKKRVVKTRVELVDAPPAAILMGFPEDSPPDEAFDYAEHQLSLRPGDELLMQFYGALAVMRGQPERCRAFIERGLGRRPLEIEWHRYYQELCDATGRHAEAAAYYRKLLDELPDDAGALYLAGRLKPRASESLPLFERAVDRDPENPYPHYAIAYQRLSAGDYAGARPHSEKAHRLKPEHAQFDDQWFEVRLALAEYDALEQELRAETAREPADYSRHLRLLQVLCAQGKTDEAVAASEQFAGTFGALAGDSESDTAIAAELVLDYLRGEISHIVEDSRRLSDAEREAGWEYIADLELGRPAGAEDALARTGDEQSPLNALLMQLAWQRQGDARRAAAWRDKAVERFLSGGPEGDLAADALSAGDGLRLEDVDDMAWPQDIQAALLLALAGDCPAHRDELLARAERLRGGGLFPWRFLRSVRSEMRKGP